MSAEIEVQPIPKSIQLAGYLLGLLMRFLFWSARKETIGLEAIRPFFEEGQPIIVAAWHNRNLLAPPAYRAASKAYGRKICVIASQSKDGELAACALKMVGIDSARGSSSRGGSQALRMMVRLLQKGIYLGITPDGPRGPCYHVEPGVIALAKLGQAPIVPLSIDAKPKKRLGSWDRLFVPLPFSKMRIVWGEPIWVDKNVSTEQMEGLALKVQEALQTIGQRAEIHD
ncbi:MAG: lysophospholipid acyltransferase family protein [Acidobacteria bacterium]|nr:lysophospholipid acyltransferase family protein [Acidobacteriota bacterium]MCB9397719.1 lysophospholipid acyltransferase family protein [Acidobacteriota bacterium]